ncbi:MAG TPA: sigma-70 family RNA polymerase sigma factor [Bacteroidia bacterium]|jgi:RNA polymerase sigma-70 factor (ECF subfamily)|nr:sigma-70 family RNA polymerase sigma factor [Bacteroidia bacterium]
MTDNELIAGCIRQDRTCQEALYKRFYGKMMGVTLRYAKNRDEASDMLQEGFIKVFTSLRNYAFKGSFEGWVRRIIVNTAVDHLRRNKHEYMIVSTVVAREGDIPDHSEETDEEDLVNALSEEEILGAVQKLSPAYRTVFNLYVIENFSHKEIAEQLNISEGTSKSNLAKARFQMKKNLYKLTKSTDGERTFTR